MTQIRKIGVVGAGTMGRGIVQLFAQAGHAVACYDAVDGAAEQGVASVRAMIDRLIEKQKIEAGRGAVIKSAIQPCTRLDELAGCDLVIEAIVEDLDVKRGLFRELEAIVGDAAILASNTSSLVVSEIAAGCRHPERIAGLHFFNPVPLMKVAEVVAAVRTADATVTALRSVVEAAGHRAVVAADQPGFLVNHAGRGLYTEGLRIVEEQVATPHEVDALMREAAGFRMGPFELMDLTGLDVSGKVMSSIYAQFLQEPRFRPSPLVPPRIAAGLFGRKTGEGWYRYVDGTKQEPPRAPPPALPNGLRVWIDSQAPQHDALTVLATQVGAQVLDESADADLCLVQFWGWDTTRWCVERGLDATRTVAVDPAPGLDRHRTAMLSVATTVSARDAAHALLTADGVPVTVIGDSAGFVVQRMLATIVNIACEIAQRGIASVEDIEDAVRLGLGYPAGPLTLGDRLGAARVLEILDNQQRLSGDPRYRPSSWLRRRAALGLSLCTPEAPRA